LLEYSTTRCGIPVGGIVHRGARRSNAWLHARARCSASSICAGVSVPASYCARPESLLIVA
jgi:hypothetical protein